MSNGEIKISGSGTGGGGDSGIVSIESGDTVDFSYEDGSLFGDVQRVAENFGNIDVTDDADIGVDDVLGDDIIDYDFVEEVMNVSMGDFSDFDVSPKLVDDDFLFGAGELINDGYGYIDELFGLSSSEDESIRAMDRAINAELAKGVDGMDNKKLTNMMKNRTLLDSMNKGWSLNPAKWGTLQWTIAAMLYQSFMTREQQKFMQKMKIAEEERYMENTKEMLKFKSDLSKGEEAAADKGGGAVSAPSGGGLVSK